MPLHYVYYLPYYDMHSTTFEKPTKPPLGLFEVSLYSF